MIRKVPYSEIHFEKYQNCLETSEQYCIFAEKKYLDLLLHNNWEILVDGDYQAVMPIPLIKKWGIKLVLMPMQTQQLGIFSKKDNAQQNEAFFSYFKNNFTVFQYSFNARNQFITELKRRTNFVLPKNNYEEIKKNYSIHRRRNVRISDTLKDKITFQEADELSEYETFFTNNAIGAETKTLKKYFRNMLKLRKENMLKVYNLFFEEILVSQAYLLESKKENILVNFINDQEYIKKNTSSILIDKTLQVEIKEKDFNFHGSSIPQIADFYRRFNANEKTYPYFENISKHWLLKNIGKIKSILKNKNLHLLVDSANLKFTNKK
jgi:hypothetical protein